MSHIRDTTIAITSFFVGYILVLIIQELLTPLLDAITETALENSSIATNIGSFGSILISIIAMLIIPSYYAYQSYQNTNQNTNPIEQNAYAAAFTLLAFTLTIVGWFWIPALASALTETFFIGLFYIGTILIWINLVIIGPYTLITKN